MGWVSIIMEVGFLGLYKVSTVWGYLWRGVLYSAKYLNVTLFFSNVHAMPTDAAVFHTDVAMDRDSRTGLV